jgi:hypothetical protein
MNENGVLLFAFVATVCLKAFAAKHFLRGALDHFKANLVTAKAATIAG